MPQFLTLFAPFLALIIALPCSGQVIGRDVIAIKDAKIQAKGRESIDFEMGGSITPTAVQGDWLNVGNGWIHKSAIRSPAEAERYFQELVKREPKNENAWFGLGNSRRLLGEYELALEALDHAVEISDNGPKMYSAIRSVIQLLRHEYDLAIEEASRGISAFQGDRENDKDSRIIAGLHCNRANAYEAKGDLSQALVDYSKSLELWPNQLTAMLRRGTVLRDLGRMEDSLDQLNAAVKATPDFPASLIYRGSVHELLGQWKDAAEDYRTALETQPNLAFAYLTESHYAYEGIGRGAIPTAALKSLDPRRSPYYCLIMLLAAAPDDSVRNGAEAVRLAKELQKLDRNRYWPFVAAEAAAYAEAGDFEQAIRLQESAIELAGEMADTKLSAALVNYRAGSPWRLQQEIAPTKSGASP